MVEKPRKSISEILAEFEEPEDREKIADDCEGCDYAYSGKHRFGCSVRGARAIKIPTTKVGDKFEF